MMIQMFVAGIGLEQRSGQPVVLLNDGDKKQALPILIGASEARAISRALQKVPSTRPSTHELLVDVISGFGYELDHVSIDNASDDTYFGKMALVPENTDHTDVVFELDARPSDAIVLAIMEGKPIYVADEVMQSSAIQMQLLNANELTADDGNFKDFVKEIKASDFNKYGSGPVELPE